MPYWAYLSNEPSLNECSNSRIDKNTEENYSQKKRLKEGDYVTYILTAKTNIKVGDEILWYYGSSYHNRDYPVSK